MKHDIDCFCVKCEQAEHSTLPAKLLFVAAAIAGMALAFFNHP